MFKLEIAPHTHLRLLEERHSEKLFALTDVNRLYLLQWLPWVDQTKNVEDTKNYIKFTLKQFAEGRALQSGIWRHEQMAGVVGFHTINHYDNVAAIGYWLGESFQGQGLMTHACKAFLDFGFRELKLNRILIRVAVGNTKSRAIPERLGFNEEGLLRESERINDRYVDAIEYGILAREWQKQ